MIIGLHIFIANRDVKSIKAWGFQRLKLICYTGIRHIVIKSMQASLDTILQESLKSIKKNPLCTISLTQKPSALGL